MGPKSGNVKKPLVFKAFLKGSKKPRAFQEHEQHAEKWRLGGGRGHFGATLEALWGHFGSTLGQLLVYSSVSVQLYDYFGIIVESLWVYESRFSKKQSFSRQVLIIL